MKRITKRQKEKSPSPPTELSAFSLAAAISEATTSSSATSSFANNSQQQQQQQPRKIFNISKNNISQVSLATNTSFATANEQPTNESVITPAASYFVDSSDEETNDEGLNFDNDPLAVLSRTSSGTPTEISFSNNNNNNNINPEETTMASKNKKSKSKITPVVEATTPMPTPPPTTMAPPKKEQPEVVVEKKVMPTTTPPQDREAHFDVAQNVYGTAKNVWAWGKTVPVIATFLDLTENVAAKVLDTAVHMDLPAIDQKAVTPQLKKLDDDIVSPMIVAIWKIIEPAVMKGEEMVVKPVLKEVVPRVLAPLSMFGDNDTKKKEEAQMKKEEMIDSSPTPEVVPALN
ncbi:hypothetical protein ACHAXR_005157 [Thalassiosira sp. AJA248-18]